MVKVGGVYHVVKVGGVYHVVKVGGAYHVAKVDGVSIVMKVGVVFKGEGGSTLTPAIVRPLQIMGGYK